MVRRTTQALLILLDRLSAADMVISHGKATHRLLLLIAMISLAMAVCCRPKACCCQQRIDAVQLTAGNLLRGGSNGVFYHAVEAPVADVVRYRAACLAGQNRRGLPCCHQVDASV